jgi:transposase InsO family protein
LGISGRIPARVDTATKEILLDLIANATDQGWNFRDACEYLELEEQRAYRWLSRQRNGTLPDREPGGHSVHGLLDWEIEAVIDLYREWGEFDRSHRKLAHRGSYTGAVWVSPSTVRRVLEAHGLELKAPKQQGSSKRRPFPEWVEWRAKQIWIYDTTHFQKCDMAVVIVMDLVSRKWLTEVVSVEETSTQVKVAFTDALELEGILPLIGANVDGLADITRDDDRRPILLAMSDNGPQMTSGSTREFMAMCSIAQHFGRPHTPTDQAWIETLNGHIKHEYPHLLQITEPSVLRMELALIRRRYNEVRLHQALGYVTPCDEHEGLGPTIRAARKAGLEKAHRDRIEFRRDQKSTGAVPAPRDAV